MINFKYFKNSKEMSVIMTKTISCAAALLASVEAIEPIAFLNVIDTSQTCNLDGDCPWQDLDYIEGNGKPKS